MRERVLFHEQYHAVHIPKVVGYSCSRNSNELVVVKGLDSLMG